MILIKLELINFLFLNKVFSFEMASQLVLTFLLLIFIGLSGILINWNNLLFTIFSIEIVNISAIMFLVIVSRVLYDLKGYLFGNFLLWLTASESAVGLGILVVLFKFGGSIRFNTYINLKG